MNYSEIFEKLERLRNAFRSIMEKKTHVSEDMIMLYGELEDVIIRVTGNKQIQIMGSGIFPNFIAARLMSGRDIFNYEALSEVLQVIGKLRQQANNMPVPRPEISLTELSTILHRFRECCQYVTIPPRNEKDVQDILWVILRSHFDRLDREDNLPRFGAKGYKPDFGVPSLSALVEVKFIGEKTDIAKIQEEILADLPGYLNENTAYNTVAILVYDAAHKLRDPRKFIDDIRTVSGVLDVIVVPGVG